MFAAKQKNQQQLEEIPAEDLSDKEIKLEYLVLKNSTIKDGKARKSFFKNDEAFLLAEEAEIGIFKLIEIFNNHQILYAPCPDKNIYKSNEYNHLERL